MSLLLDALRRAGAARGDDIAEPVNQRTSAGARATPRAHGDELDLDLDAVTAAETEPGTDNAEDAPRLQGPARAEAVFRGGAAGGSVVRTAALFTLGALALLGGLVVGGWYYYESTRSAVDRELVRYTPDAEPGARAGNDGEAEGGAAEPSADVAVDPEALEPRDTAQADRDDAADAPEVDAAAALASASRTGADAGDASVDDGTQTEPDGTAPAADGEPTAGDAGMAAEATGADEPASGASDTTTAEAGAPEATSASDEEAAAGTADTGQAAPAGASTSSDQRTSNADVRAEADTGDDPVVRRSAGGDGRSPLAEALQAGYGALRSGDLMAAREHYRRALELGPSNRDARLGAAAVAQRQGNAAAAIEHYRKVLADHPRDPYARSGLASLESTADPRQIESELKTLLKQDPNAHALRYALGNLYAREDRWSQAQSAYFEAFRTAPKEADYAFNLAVALDRLGQREAAVKYYDQALDLAGDGSASFALESAKRRLESLRQ